MSTFQISPEPIEASALRARLADPGCGAYVQFEGWVRNHNEGQRVLRLEYEVYEPLAVKEGRRIVDEAIERFGVSRAGAIHRSGLLELTDLAVIVGVAAPHRGEAFDACRYIIDQVKVRLPIWKKEFYANGAAEWVNCRRCAEAGHHHEL
jgi:molybdopterin synthase catalytic subunit